jgi:hypothetical protein
MLIRGCCALPLARSADTEFPFSVADSVEMQPRQEEDCSEVEAYVRPEYTLPLRISDE